jgi:exodeoxyribonuclease VII large subunit
VQETFTVGELCASIERAVRAGFPTEVWVAGAISGITRSATGHVYFDLVEPGALGDTVTASVPVVLFSARRRLVNQILTRSGGGVRMTDGTEIRIRGEVGFYPRGGRVQLVMSLIDPAYTLGQLAQARLRLLGQLEAEGLLGANRRHPFPVLPLRVALVTSDGSAAHADFHHELARSGYRFELQVIDARVQGPDAAQQLVWALREAVAWGPDVVALVRGGGARTDLVAFDHEAVVRAVAACPVPVITGIGHETDRSVCDEVAHTAAKTPTACAGLLVGLVREFAARVEAAAERLVLVAGARLEAAEGDLAGRAQRAGRAGQVALARADAGLGDRARRLRRAGRRAHQRHHEHLGVLSGRLRRAAPGALERATHPVTLAEVRLRAVDPTEALRRGWSITRTAGGRLVTDPAEVVHGERLVTTLAGGELTSVVDAPARSHGPSTS